MSPPPPPAAALLDNAAAIDAVDDTLSLRVRLGVCGWVCAACACAVGRESG